MSDTRERALSTERKLLPTPPCGVEAGLQEVFTHINTVIADLANVPLTTLGTSCPSGTLNAMGLSCTEAYSGTGQQSNDGFEEDYSYSTQLFNANDLMDFTMTTAELSSGAPISSEAAVMVVSFQGVYFQDPNAYLTATASYTQITCSEVVCCCGDPVSSCCYDTCSVCTNLYTIGPVTDGLTVDLGGAYVSGVVTFTASCTPPPTSYSNDVPITVSIPGSVSEEYYVYDISFSNLYLSFQSYSISGNDFGYVSSYYISEILNTYLMGYVTSGLNTYMATVEFDVSLEAEDR